MKRLIPLAMSLAIATHGALAADMTDEQKTLYALGQMLASQTTVFRLSADEITHVQKGWRDATLKTKSAVDVAQYAPKVNALAQSRAEQTAREESEKGKKLLATAAAEKGAVKAASGFIYLPLVVGKGAKPAATDTVRVHYRGTLPDGTEFDSSYSRNEPTEFPLNRVIKCWTEGVAMMKVGGKAKLTCPADTAYGNQSPSPLIKPGATLLFEIELLEVKGK
ncbi:MAG TPA: FKBP-type peptidyl-prolyl cis-trans isomerase [Rhodocyclaceae bacterium]